jgi:hypothetical protein
MYLNSHVWKSFIRNERWRRNLLARILFILLGLYFVLMFLILGYTISSDLAGEGGDSAGKFFMWILYYLAADYLMRCFLQQIPSLEVLPYLRFRIRRKKLVNHLLVRSSYSIFNILPLFILIPFSVMVLGPSMGVADVLVFLAGCILLIILNNMMGLLTGLLTRINSVYWIIPLGVAALFALSTRLEGSLNEPSRMLGYAMAEGHPLPFLVIVSLIIAIIRLINRLLHRYLRVDLAGTHYMLRSKGTSFSGRFSRLGDTGRYMSLELSMLLRNKRSRKTLLIVPFFMVYAVVFFLFMDEMHSEFFTILITTMFLGLGSMSYGQFIFSWESSWFDGLMARKNNMADYVKAKFYLLVLITLVSFVPLAVVVCISGKISLILLTALMLFILGPGSLITMLLATLNDARIDLDTGTFMNYQGMKGSQFIMTFLFVLIPVLIYDLIRLVANENTATIILASIGIIFIASSNWWLKKYIAGTFTKRKYKSLEGYRKLSS